jgi:hypothetical protein
MKYGFNLFDDDNFCFFNGRHLLSCTIDASQDPIHDLINRAAQDYRLEPTQNLNLIRSWVKNIKCTADLVIYQQILDAWLWVRRLYDSKKGSSIDITKGICGLLEKEEVKQTDERRMLFGSYLVITSPARESILNLCDWIDLNNQQKLDEICSRLEDSQFYSRSAAIAVFHFDFQRACRAIDIGYTQTKNVQFTLVKAVLEWLKSIMSSTVSDGGVGVEEKMFKSVQKMCSTLIIEDNYLKAIVQFLNGETIQLEKMILFDVMNEISIYDRIAYAARFLANKELETALIYLKNEATKNGNLGGICLNSDSSSTTDIIQNFINQTNDIQTAGLLGGCLALLHFTNPGKLRNWYNDYRSYLHTRQQFDALIRLDKSYAEIEKSLVGRDKKSGAPGQGVEGMQNAIDLSKAIVRCKYCACNFTHQSLTMNLNQTMKGYATLCRKDTPSIRVCPQCLRQLPKCSICLLAIQIVNPYPEIQENAKRGPQFKKTETTGYTFPLDDSIIWCQTCKHGGHFEHIMEWFREHNTCPVSDCQCECDTL